MGEDIKFNKSLLSFGIQIVNFHLHFTKETVFYEYTIEQNIIIPIGRPPDSQSFKSQIHMHRFHGSLPDQRPEGGSPFRCSPGESYQKAISMESLVACLIWPVTAVRMWPHCICWLWHCRQLWNSLFGPIVRGHCLSQPAIITNQTIWSELPLFLPLPPRWEDLFTESTDCGLPDCPPIGMDMEPFRNHLERFSFVILFVLFFFDSLFDGGSTDYTYLIIHSILDSFKHCFNTTLLQIYINLAYIKRSFLSFRSENNNTQTKT